MQFRHLKQKSIYKQAAVKEYQSDSSDKNKQKNCILEDARFSFDRLLQVSSLSTCWDVECMEEQFPCHTLCQAAPLPVSPQPVPECKCFLGVSVWPLTPRDSASIYWRASVDTSLLIMLLYAGLYLSTYPPPHNHLVKISALCLWRYYRLYILVL